MANNREKQEILAKKFRFALQRGKLNQILNVPLHQRHYYNGLNWALRNDEVFYTGGSFEKFYSVRVGLRTNSGQGEYFGPSLSSLDDIHSFCGIMHYDKIIVGGINSLYVYQ
jgi:hypothetical protein